MAFWRPFAYRAIHVCADFADARNFDAWRGTVPRDTGGREKRKGMGEERRNGGMGK